MRVIGVFKTHFDYGYTDFAHVIRKKYSNEIIAKVIQVCRESEKDGLQTAYRWTLPSWLLMDIYDRAEGEIEEEFIRLVQEDRITCHALPFTVHSQLLSKRQLEDLFLSTERFTKVFQKPFPISAKMTDVPGHTSAFIKPLVSRGVRFLHLGKNPYSTAPDVPLLFWWEDLEGNRILTMYTRFYGSKILPPKGWKYPVWMALNQTGDNEGGHSVSVVAEMRSALPKDWEFQTGSMDDFARELLKCDLSTLPVVKGELGDTWIHGAGTYPCAMGKFRRARKRAYALIDLAKERGIDVQKEADTARDIALQFTEHTFGANVCKYVGYEREYEKQAFLAARKNRPEYVFLEASWEEQRETVYALEKAVDTLANKVGAEPLEEEKDQRSDYKIEKWAGRPRITFPSGKKVSLDYEYAIIGADALHLFMKKYLVRISDWSAVDFGKLRYPEIDDARFKGKLKRHFMDGEEYVFEYVTPQESVEKYGNARGYTLRLKAEREGVRIRLSLFDKQATPFVEAGGLRISGDLSGKKKVQICGTEIDVEKDIVKDANQILWAMDEYVKIGNVKLYSYDAPLVSFTVNPIMKFNGGKPKKQGNFFNVNLFNNQWGTNFPQWIEGDLTFEFFLSEEDI